ncbi:MAG: cytoplasmic rane protein [Planctomycetota bacterium]|nr:cytoplasmic rane protein [Planctomycetota bacterium]
MRPAAPSRNSRTSLTVRFAPTGTGLKSPPPRSTASPRRSRTPRAASTTLRPATSPPPSAASPPAIPRSSARRPSSSRTPSDPTPTATPRITRSATPIHTGKCAAGLVGVGAVIVTAVAIVYAIYAYEKYAVPYLDYEYEKFKGAWQAKEFAEKSANISKAASESEVGDAGHNGVAGPPEVSRRHGRDGEAARITYPDGSVKDVTSTRVKEFVPKTHPNAPKGKTMEKVEFENHLPGDKTKRALTDGDFKDAGMQPPRGGKP